MFKCLSIASCLLSITTYAAVIEINDLNKFNDTIKSGKSVVKFYMDNCPPCRASSPMFNTLSNNSKYKDVKFITSNLQRGRTIVIKYARMFPTIAFFKDGKKVGANIVGYDGSTRSKIMARLDSL